MTVFVLLTARIIAAHPELAGRTCYSAHKVDGPLHRLVIPGLALQRTECEFCAMRDAQRLRGAVPA